VYHLNPVETRPFAITEAVKESFRQKRRVSDISTDTSVKVASEAEVGARAKPFSCNRLFSDSQEKSPEN
jgi:hypothetical protein